VNRKAAIIVGGFALLALGIWFGMHIERWLVVDACLDAGGHIDLTRGFYNCELE
jgi:hypothetical protein